MGTVKVVYPKYNIVGLNATSRVYSTQPSVSQIPKVLRKAIIPYSGRQFLYADLKAAEVYILVKWAKCYSLIDAYEKGEDLYSVIAKKVLNKDEVTTEERNTIKAVILSILYGSEGYSAARVLHIEEDTAKGLVETFFKVYPEIENFQKTIHQYILSHGYIETFFFRPRILKVLSDDETGIKRQGINTAIQGTCADCLKICLGALDNKDIRFVTSVFDSVLLEVHNSMTKEQARDFLSDFFSKCPPFKFRFEFGLGSNWGEAQENMEH